MDKPMDGAIKRDIPAMMAEIGDRARAAAAELAFACTEAKRTALEAAAGRPAAESGAMCDS